MYVVYVCFELTVVGCIMSSDSEYEEEEFCVLANFKNQLISQDIHSNAIKIVGIGTKNPIAEINGNVFKGAFDYAMGTSVCFEKDSTESNIDPLFQDSCKQRYKVIATTKKVINFQRIYIEKKQLDSGEETNERSSVIESGKENPSLTINVTYEDAIRQFPVCGGDEN